MTVSMYSASVPVYTQFLTALSNVLKKGAAFAEAKKIDPTVLINARIAPDMFALARQVQIATDHAKGSLARLAGVEPPKYEDTETTFDELEARIQKTLAYVKTFKPEQIDGTEGKEIVLTFGTQKFPFNGQTYLIQFALPNFYFHTSMAYAILRHNGVEIGKRDFMGGV
ncbi:MAG TPA: DUF1993 domain-containing protein [Rhizomicrobium sp.]|nr:DUF1993 domain-containing protein [Rhizomicrobium sp.]